MATKKAKKSKAISKKGPAKKGPAPAAVLPAKKGKAAARPVAKKAIVKKAAPAKAPKKAIAAKAPTKAAPPAKPPKKVIAAKAPKKAAPAKAVMMKAPMKAAPARAPKKAAAAPALRKAPPAKVRPRLRREDHPGHLDPHYAAALRRQSGRRTAEPRAFLDGPRSPNDDFAEEIGEEVIEKATTGEDEGEETLNQIVPEETGGPFVETTAGQEFAGGVDASNPKGAKREPFPRT